MAISDASYYLQKTTKTTKIKVGKWGTPKKFKKKVKKPLHNLENQINTNFEQYLNKRQRTENEQMQDPLPVIEVKIPPINPLNRSTRAFHNLKSWIESKVRRLCCLQKNKQMYSPVCRVVSLYLNSYIYLSSCLSVSKFFYISLSSCLSVSKFLRFSPSLTWSF